MSDACHSYDYLQPSPFDKDRGITIQEHQPKSISQAVNLSDPLSLCLDDGSFES